MAKATGMSFQAVIPNSYMDNHGVWVDDLLIANCPPSDVYKVRIPFNIYTYIGYRQCEKMFIKNITVMQVFVFFTSFAYFINYALKTS